MSKCAKQRKLGCEQVINKMIALRCDGRKQIHSVSFFCVKDASKESKCC